MKKFRFQNLFLILLFSALIISCDEDSTSSPTDEFVAKQSDLNSATKVFDLNVTGSKYGPATVPHNGVPEAGVFDTYRDIYTNLASNDLSNIQKGDIITKRVYARNNDGSKGDLMVTFAMIKREDGYDEDNGNWEYVMMPADTEVDYNTMPNGKLPDPDTEGRGKLAMCAGCHNQAEDGSGLFIRNTPETIEITQADIDNAVSMFELDITGDKYGNATIAHGGQDLTSDETFRDVFSSWAEKDQEIKPGDVVIKHTYMKNQDESKGDLLVTFAMIKREEGYFPGGGDWEYVMMPFNSEVNYDDHPNGQLPTDPSAKGKLAMCADCHASAPGTNYLFVR